MWVVLMNVGQLSHWLLHRNLTPKQQTGIPAGSPSLELNNLTALLMVCSAFLFLLWALGSLPVLLLLLAFPISTSLYFAVFPVSALVLFPQVIDWIEHRLGDKYEGASQAFTLKIASALLFCASASATQFVPLYSGDVGYGELLQESLSEMGDLFLKLSRLFVFDFPTLDASLSLPDLPRLDTWSFAISAGLAVTSYALPLFLAFYRRHLKHD